MEKSNFYDTEDALVLGAEGKCLILEMFDNTPEPTERLKALFSKMSK